MKKNLHLYIPFFVLALLLYSCVEMGLESPDPVRPDRLVLLQKYGAAMREVMPTAGTTTRQTRSWTVSGTDYDNAFQAYKYGLEGTAINRLLGYAGPVSLQMNLDTFDGIVAMINSNVRYENGSYLLVDGAPGTLSIRDSITLDQLGLGTIDGPFVELDLAGILHTYTYGTIGTTVTLSNQRVAFSQSATGEQILIYYVEPILPGLDSPMSLLLYGLKTATHIDFRIANFNREDADQTDYVQSSMAVSSNVGTYQVRSRMDMLSFPASPTPGQTNTFLLQGDRILFSIRGRKLNNAEVRDECFNVNPVNFAKLFPDGDDGSVTNTTVWSGSNALTNITMPLVHDMDANQLPHNSSLTSVASLRWW